MDKQTTLGVILLPALLAIMADGTMTALRQTNWSNVAEANPQARAVLSSGPMAWIIYVGIYALMIFLVLFVAGIKYPIVTETGSLFFGIFHGIGVISWFGIFLPGRVWAVGIYATLPSLVWFVFRMFQWEQQQAITYRQRAGF